jgi:glutamyl-tRNA synthetase
VFAHVPVIVNEKRQKLSKRRDKVALEMYRDEGYLPEVMLNYLCLIGWAPADGRERLTLDEMVREFRLEDVNSSPGFFDIAKLRAFNGDTLRAMPVDEFVALADGWLPPAWDRAVFARLAPLVQERTFLLGEVPDAVEFLFVDEPLVDEAAWSKAVKGDGAAYLDGVLTGFDDLEGWSAEAVKAVLDGVAEQHGVNPRKVHAVVRVAVTGRGVGLPLFESLEALGRNRTVQRLRVARGRL